MNKTTLRLLKRAANVIPPRYRARAALLYFYVLSLRYSGKERSCPCCGGDFRTFLPSPLSQRPDTLCPRCLSLERHRLLWLYLREKTDFFSAPLRVLHFAPELCFTGFTKLPNLDYISADLDSPLAMVAVDITAIGYEANHFDVILCNHVLEHIPDDRQAMRELYRVLKPGGWAILQSPLNTERDITYEDPTITTPQQRQQHYGHHDHKRFYGRDYGDRLAEAGFSVHVDPFVRELDPSLIARYGLTATEDIYFCRKELDYNQGNAG